MKKIVADVVESFIVPVIKFEKMNDLWNNVWKDVASNYCATQNGGSPDEFVITFEKMFNRKPEFVYQFKNIFYIPQTKAEYDKWLSERDYKG